MAGFWMVRAGKGGYVFDDFMKENAVAIGYASKVDLTPAKNKSDVKSLVMKVHPSMSGNGIAVVTKFRCVMTPGDGVLTYNPSTREYQVGKIASDYVYKPGAIPDHPHLRSVTWRGPIGRDLLSPSTRNTLGSTLTLFEPGEEVEREIEKLITGGTATSATPLPSDEEDTDAPDTIREDQEERSKEFIKDRISSLSWEGMQLLVAAILRAMGYKTRVSPGGGDRGKDIVASPDGLGLSPPRIKVEVKHRPNTKIDAPEVRSFIGGLRGDDRGLYVSTGGFTKEAHYEAERASLAVNLIDLEILAGLLTQHYEALDSEGKALVPLIRIYWPVDAK